MDRLSLWKEKIEGRLRELFSPLATGELYDAMTYYVFQPGKRIRPLITVAVAHSLGGDENDAITAGCAIEIIHNYSLVHDDLPAMDNDAFRRGLPSCHVKFGEGIAILAGDALLTYAFEVLTREGAFKTLSPKDILNIVNIIAVKSGVSGMVGGQALDIGGEEDLEKVNIKKTAALFEACFMCGGIVSHREDRLPVLEEVGREFGLLFQLADDILDRDGFFLLLGEEEARRRAKTMYNSLLEKLREISLDGSEIESLVRLVYSRVT
ncbi:farnesyl-diphosphate synthase [Hydrogenivirga caldilitoris]|uniref:Farnesyl-diphosphate synthase n=1 Tax=Hydrogenivirga caldilitoris TaxID=246264 RepID=A0A497XT61_9AQUI|nr:polyprenyl synthetase family protein [Hydrogenivirga caldilitoris]RLJ71299.1 farnesyl-diphosphate synthase [Hydrogenivirga caldilitoris]